MMGLAWCCPSVDLGHTLLTAGWWARGCICLCQLSLSPVNMAAFASPPPAPACLLLPLILVLAVTGHGVSLKHTGRLSVFSEAPSPRRPVMHRNVRYNCRVIFLNRWVSGLRAGL